MLILLVKSFKVFKGQNATIKETEEEAKIPVQCQPETTQQEDEETSENQLVRKEKRALIISN